MKKGINKVTLVGRVGKGPEVRYRPEGGAVAVLSLATSETWRDKSTGEMKEDTEWHRVVLFDKAAEIAEKHVKKGTQIYVEGKLKTRKWEDDKQIERFTTEVIVNTYGEFQLLGNRAEQSPTPASSQDADVPEGDIPF